MSSSDSSFSVHCVSKYFVRIKTKKHTLSLLLGLLLSGGTTSGSSSTSSWGSTSGTARWDGSQLGGTLSDQLIVQVSQRNICALFLIVADLVDVLSIELLDESVETLVVDLNADRLEDGSDVLSGRGGLSTDGEEEVCCEVLHFDCCAQILSVDDLRI